MEVTLEVFPIEILKGLSGNSRDEDFNKALDNATEAIKGTQLNFVDAFYSEFQELAPNKKLSSIFSTAANRDRFGLNATDAEILEVINTEVEDAINRSFNILRTRIDRFGTSQPNIQRLQGTGRIQIELPGIDNPQRVRKLLQGVAKLEFWEVKAPEEYFPIMEQINSVLVKEMKLALPDSIASSTETDELSALLTEDPNETTLSNPDADSANVVANTDTSDAAIDSLLNTQVSPIFSLLKANYGLVYEVRDTVKINRIFAREDIKAMIPRSMKLAWDVKPISNTDITAPKLLQLNVLDVPRNGKAPLEGDVITDARFELDERARPGVAMQMNPTGAKAWRRLTAANVGQQIAIVLDGYVYSAPNVMDEIPSGRSSISGNFTREEAVDLANILKAGALPAPTTIVSDVVTGPTLGKVAQMQGLISILAGLGVVILFMIFYYAKGGLIANLALFVNIFFILGILASTQGVALTLAGIAGIVLTIGMSIDANVLIFERIKEELRNGAGMKQAISTGYKKAYWSIFDANVTTLIVGIILFTLGTGPVKGFAITLMIGIASSFFSAVFITRVIVEAFTKKGDKSTMTFDTGISRNFLIGLNYDFLGKRKLAYLFSAAFITIGIVALIAKGVTLGVDFKGGRSFIVNFEQSQVPSKMKPALVTYFDNEGTEVKTYGADNILKVTTSYEIDDSSDAADEKVRKALIAGMEDYTKLKYVEDPSMVDATSFSISGQSKVSATIADDIKNTSYQSGAIALILIFLYIVLRFRKWQFGLGAIIALLHDALFVLSAFAIANLFGISLEVDQVFVAAILTIIGYSINDTVVVFDRIRENQDVKAGSESVRVFNEALNSTISRTMITSLTTLVVVIVLFIFGGPALQAFSFALIVGILVGTYSSIFIATPIVVDLNKENK
jgi:SecD/SecF fusion protein